MVFEFDKIHIGWYVVRVYYLLKKLIRLFLGSYYSYINPPKEFHKKKETLDECTVCYFNVFSGNEIRRVVYGIDELFINM